MSQSQPYCKVVVIWLIFAEWLQRIARLFSDSLCSSSVTGEALGKSQVNLDSGLVELRSELELGQSSLEESNGLSVISFKSQLNHLGREGTIKWRFRGNI